jgi:hypothetical protein
MSVPNSTCGVAQGAGVILANGPPNVQRNGLLCHKTISGSFSRGDPGFAREPAREDEMEIPRPISEKKLQANRANANKSTGPKTSAGKAAVRRNALKHGLRSNMLSVRPAECVECFYDMLLNIKTTGEPETVEEKTLLEEIAGLWWKLRRLVQQQGDLLSRSSDPGSDRPAILRLFRRYEGSLSRQLSVRIHRWVELRRNPANL